MRYVNLNGEGVALIGSVFLVTLHLGAFARVVWITMHVFEYVWREQRDTNVY